jgi:hypothetical protein
MRTRSNMTATSKIWALSGMIGVLVVLLVAFIYLGLIAVGILPTPYWV